MLRYFSVAILICGIACAQDFPTKPIRLVTSEPGGNADLTARIIAQGLSIVFHHPVIVDNRGGASGVIAIEIVARAPADGYTLILFSPSLWTLPLIQRVNYDAQRDLSAVTLAVTTPNILVVHPALPVTSVNTLIAYAKSRPGELNYAIGSTGAASHLAAEMFKLMAGVRIVGVPFRGTAPALNSVLGGQVQMMFAAAGPTIAQIQAGRLRALAVTSARPSALLPELPTMAASGLPGFEIETNTGMFVPAGTPAPIIRKLRDEVVRALNRAEAKEKLAQIGVEVVGNTPEEFAAKVKADMVRLGKVVKNAGIRVD